MTSMDSAQDPCEQSESEVVFQKLQRGRGNRVKEFLKVKVREINERTGAEIFISVKKH